MTKREHMPIGYDVKLDRRQPPSLGCLKIVIPALILVGALVSLGWGISFALQQNQPQIPTLALIPSEAPQLSAVELSPATATNSPTPDEWGATGTALAFATASPPLDYCWWLTPTATHTPTLAFTPDAWGATGTAVYLATYPYQVPTAQPARELCFEFPTFTPTLTPFPLDGLFASVEITPEVTSEVSPEIPLPMISPPATWTREPVVQTPVVQPPVVQPPADPVIITQPPIVITSPPVIVTQPPQIIVITATLAPTATPTHTATDLPPVLPTQAPTNTHTPTLTASPTAAMSATPTPTFTPTYTATHTDTASPTATWTPTNTDTPTATPTETETVP